MDDNKLTKKDWWIIIRVFLFWDYSPWLPLWLLFLWLLWVIVPI
jgi:hypothetical protein